MDYLAQLHKYEESENRVQFLIGTRVSSSIKHRVQACKSGEETWEATHWDCEQKKEHLCNLKKNRNSNKNALLKKNWKGESCGVDDSPMEGAKVKEEIVDVTEA